MSRITADSQRHHLSWGRTPKLAPARVVAPGWQSEVTDLGGFDRPLLAYGQGRSYGDACLNEDGVILDTIGLDRFIAFDPASGLVRCEAGVTLADVLALVVPHGWFLPVTPGTKYVTVAGAVANDVHGKNHHAAGTFGRFVTRLELKRSSGETLDLTPEAGAPEADLFRATVGGLGLTGFITWVEFRLVPIASDQITGRSTKFESLEAFFALSEVASGESPYVVSWIDTLRPEGRGILMQGDHAASGDLPEIGDTPPEAKLGLPINAPNWALNKLTVRAFNAAYYGRQRQREAPIWQHYEPFFYPLDIAKDWNRGYGKRGFFQYQFVVPFADGGDAVREILGRLAASGEGSFLAVLKTFGDVPSPGIMSFPREGVTLALDLPNRGAETVRLLRGCDAIVREAGGAVYPAKDATMTPESFRAFFPQWEAFAEHIDPAFSSSFWRRVTHDS
ncbi:FAD-binding oxidoreductase [Rubricoccus marinus]|uniref:FAD-binding oxidoreductase n=1 Tax=Rubricoccus marinus TaxID=716817 RepID=A0A259U179_9BACT|nr:FAD-binding oxidoreductase [Rubricoccus marinus]OZC03783.1 FAD-binding oxidoreductase [Rubricoccus marinus]